MLRLRLLGPPEVTFDGNLVQGFISEKALALLCYLVLKPGIHAREKLASLLWGDFPAERARANLRQVLSNLQKLFPGYFDVTRKSATFLSTESYWLDVEEFGLQTAVINAPISREIAQNAQATLSLYRGDFLSDMFIDGAPEFESWSSVERERLRLLLLKTLEKMGVYYAHERSYEAAIGTLQRILTIEPWHESTHRHLMLLYARLGEYGAALKQFDKCRQVLVDELGVEPLAETIAQYERIRAARTLSRTPLPPQPTPFVGRTKELDDLEALLLDENVHLVTITGLGGTGKTRLALAAAEALAPAFIEGVAYVPLSAITDIEGIISALAQALGIRIQGGADPVEQIANYLHGKEILLILDNIEQLIDEAGTLEPILVGAPGVRVLATSRRLLNLRWEHTLPLTGLPAFNPELVSESPAGKLFIQSARRTQPDFEPEKADWEDIHQICEMVEGLPLGIELASSWLRVLSCADIAREMQHNQAFLATTKFRGPGRQRSLWSTFSYSWQMLAHEEQAVFKVLSVFRGGFSRQAAEEVANPRLPILSALVNMSLLRNAGNDRYQIHELLRQFATEKLAESEASVLETTEAHSRTYLGWLAGSEVNLKQRGMEETADEIQVDWDNIRFAWQWAVEKKNFDWIDQSSTALYEFCNLRQHYQEGKTLFLEAAEATGSQPGYELLHARLQLALSAFYFYLGMIPESLHELNDSEAFFHQAGLEHELALNFMWTGFISNYTRYNDQLSKGEALLEQSLEIFEALGDDYYQARCLGNLGNVLAGRGEHKLAMQHWNRGLALFEALGIAWGQAGMLVMLGKFQPLAKEEDPAPRPYLQEGLEIAQRIGHKQIAMFALGGLGVAAENEGELRSAQGYYQEALDYARAMGHMTSIADHLNLLGYVTYQLGQTERAKDYLDRSLVLTNDLGYQVNLSSVHTNFGILEREAGNLIEAAHKFDEALRVEAELSQTEQALRTLAEVAELDRLHGGQNPNLPVLLSFLISQPLSTPAIKTQAAEIAEAINIELSPELESEAAEQSLEDVIEIVLNDMLSSEDSSLRSE